MSHHLEEGIKKSTKITPYAAGSLREVVYLSVPLMLAALSGSLMIFIDRVILAQYSLDALASVVVAGSVIFIFQFGGLALTSVSEVLVGQFNGAGRLKELGRPPWQMLLLSLFAVPFALLIGFFAGPFVLGNSELAEGGLGYFCWCMCFLPFVWAGGALSGFFVGQGKVGVVTLSFLAANLVNIGLDFLLVFGFSPFIPALGVEGAAIATVVGQFLQFAILFVLFWSKKNRRDHGTGDASWDMKLLRRCVRIGAPIMVGYMLEIAAWAFCTRLTAELGAAYVAAMAVAHGFFLLLSPVNMGLEKGVVTLCSNYIGENRRELVPKSIKAAMHFWAVVGFMAFPLFLIFPDVVLGTFLGSDEEGQILKEAFRPFMLWLWVANVAHGFVWIFEGALTAFEDTRFLMVANSTSMWLLIALPFYLALVVWGLEPWAMWVVFAGHAGFIPCVLASRYLCKFARANIADLSEQELQKNASH